MSRIFCWVLIHKAKCRSPDLRVAEAHSIDECLKLDLQIYGLGRMLQTLLIIALEFDG